LGSIVDTVAPRSEDSKLIIRVIAIELTQHICPGTLTSLTDTQTDGQMNDFLLQYRAMLIVHRVVKSEEKLRYPSSCSQECIRILTSNRRNVDTALYAVIIV